MATRSRAALMVVWALTAAALTCALAAPGVGWAQTAPALTVEDYIQIRSLVARYALALDGGANAGFDYADLFAPGAEFIRPYTVGRDKLAQLALDQPHGPLFTRHFITNHVIDPAPGGATGKQYLLVADISETRGKPGTVFLTGHYEDQYVKTAQGWRFKRREFIPSRIGPAPATPTAQGPANPPAR